MTPKRTGARALLCAGALAGGASLAAWADPADLIAPREVRAADSVPERDVLTAGTSEPSAPETQLIAFDPMVFDTGLDTFGERLGDGMPITGATPHRLILFTFDDGPDHRYTPRLLDHLDAAGVKGVFFLTAARMRGDNNRQREHQAIAREIVRRGHMVGNHTLEHAQLPVLTDQEVLAQITEAERIFEDVLGQRPWLFRHPGGARSDRVDALVADRGYTSVLWNLGTGDFLVRTPEEVYGTWRRVFERRREEYGDRGGVVLLHDIHEWSVEAFPLIVQHLRDANCELLERGEELYDIVDDPTLFHVPRADAPPQMDAPPARPAPAILEARQERLREEARRRCTALAQR